jgi:hypothetical protein
MRILVGSGNFGTEMIRVDHRPESLPCPDTASWPPYCPASIPMDTPDTADWQQGYGRE